MQLPTVRVGERMSCEASAIFFANFAYIPQAMFDNITQALYSSTKIGCKKLHSTEVNDTIQSPNASATFYRTKYVD